MKNKIKLYATKAYAYGIFVAIGVFNLVNAIEEKLGWFSIAVCAVWLIVICCFAIQDRVALSKLLEKEVNEDNENTSILGAQLYGKAKLEKNKQDNDLDIKMGKPKSKTDDLDIKMLHDLENKNK